MEKTANNQKRGGTCWHCGGTNTREVAGIKGAGIDWGRFICCDCGGESEDGGAY